MGMVSLLKWMFLLVFVIALIAITVRTLNLSRPKASVQECKATDTDFIRLDDKKVSKFQQALQFETISWASGKYNTEELLRLGVFIMNAYPTIHKKSPYVEWERVNNYSLLYHIKGSNPDLKPYLLMSHLDVVPVTNPEVWDVPAFSGKIHDGFIYGRGTIDDKLTAMGILEALEYLLIRNQRPKRSFYVVFGHDEEVEGNDGAGELSKRLREKGITELEFISDEGMPITHGIMPGIKKPFASVGVTEKGYLVLKLSIKGTPGHSSMPGKESIVKILTGAVERLESNPLPSVLSRGSDQEMFEGIAGEVNIIQRIMLANLWLFEPVVSWFLSQTPYTNALIRTVTSVTMINAGIKVNVIPSYAEAVVNHRIHPAQTIQEVIDHDRRVIGDDRVNIEVVSSFDPHPISGYRDETFGYQVLKTSINQVWPDAIVGPGVCVGRTDSYHYLNFSRDVYRFNPAVIVPGDPARFHGNNERVSVKNYEQTINFYYHLMRNADQAGVLPVHKSHEEF